MDIKSLLMVKSVLHKSDLDEMILMIKLRNSELDTPEKIVKYATGISRGFRSFFFENRTSTRPTISQEEFDTFWEQLKEEYVALGGNLSLFPASPSGEQWEFRAEEA